jgi:hypothetical protein
MPISKIRIAASAALIAVGLTGCQLKHAPVPPNFITSDSTFVLHSVDRYDEGVLSGTDTMIVVVKATYTNPEAGTETITPDRFQLIDPTLETVYYGLNGGDIHVPSMSQTSLAPGKPLEITVGFRVPASMAGGRLVYRP